jgi:hypothetical protein
MATKPNILFFHVDNLGMGELGCYGGGIAMGAPTPNVDRLARKHETADDLTLNDDGEKNMLVIMATALITVWLLVYGAFHVTAAFIHVALIAGLALLVLHFARRGTTNAYTAGQP